MRLHTFAVRTTHTCFGRPAVWTALYIVNIVMSGEPDQNGAEANALTPQLADSLKILKAEDASFHSAHMLLGRKHSIAGVLDGHGGPAAARHCQSCLPKYIEELVEGGASLEDACTRSFERCHPRLACCASGARPAPARPEVGVCR